MANQAEETIKLIESLSVNNGSLLVVSAIKANIRQQAAEIEELRMNNGTQAETLEKAGERLMAKDNENARLRAALEEAADWISRQILARGHAVDGRDNIVQAIARALGRNESGEGGE